MLSTIAAMGTWLLATVFIFTRLRASERSAMHAAILVAVAATISMDSVYGAVDGWLGGIHLTRLLENLLLMLGVWLVARAMMRTESATKGVSVLLGVHVLVLSTAGLTGAYLYALFRDELDGARGPTADAVAIAVYQVSQRLYPALVMAALAVLAWRNRRSPSGRPRFAELTLMLTGALTAGVLAVTIAASVAHAAGADWIADVLGPTYPALSNAAFVLGALGFGAVPIGRRVRGWRWRRRISFATRRLEPLWQRAVDGRPRLPQPAGEGDPAAQLHRMVVEILDSEMDGRSGFTMTRRERRLVTDAESVLLDREVPATAASRSLM